MSPHAQHAAASDWSIGARPIKSQNVTLTSFDDPDKDGFTHYGFFRNVTVPSRFRQLDNDAYHGSCGSVPLLWDEKEGEDDAVPTDAVAIIKSSSLSTDGLLQGRLKADGVVIAIDPSTSIANVYPLSSRREDAFHLVAASEIMGKDSQAISCLASCPERRIPSKAQLIDGLHNVSLQKDPHAQVWEDDKGNVWLLERKSGDRSTCRGVNLADMALSEQDMTASIMVVD